MICAHATATFTLGSIASYTTSSSLQSVIISTLARFTEFNVTTQIKLLFQEPTPIGLIEIWQHRHHRWLNIDAVEQTRIDSEKPNQLVSSLHHYFLTALLFINTPKTVLLGGLGGGAIARYLHNKQPEIEGCAIEIDETIASLAREYFYFPKNQWNIIVDDLQNVDKGNNDFIVIDIADNRLTPTWLTTEKMLIRLKQQLTESGVLAINLLVTDAQALSQVLETARNIFDRHTLCVSVPDHRNIILFAFNQTPDYSLISELKKRSQQLTDAWGIDFTVLLEQLQKDNPVGSGVI